MRTLVSQHLRAEGWEITDDQLGYLSPLGWGHINLTGDYTWDLGAEPGSSIFR